MELPPTPDSPLEAQQLSQLLTLGRLLPQPLTAPGLSVLAALRVFPVDPVGGLTTAHLQRSNGFTPRDPLLKTR
jgi:hypothetical protein